LDLFILFFQFVGGNHPKEDLAKIGYKPKDIYCFFKGIVLCFGDVLKSIV
jgi:hypothetical protein